MPRRDGTGPMGAGSMTGRGLGSCTGVNAVKNDAGLGLLQEQRDMLKSRLDVMDKQLENL